MAIPRVTMHEVRIDVHGVEIRATPYCAESRTQRLRAGEITRVQFEADDLEISFLETLIAKATHFDGDRFCQLARQIANVHARAAIDSRRIFVSQEQDLHTLKSRARLWLAFDWFASEMLALFCAHEQYWNLNSMTHLVGSRPVQNVANEAVPVCSHGDQVHIFLPGEFDDFIGWFAQRQHRVA